MITALHGSFWKDSTHAGPLTPDPHHSMPKPRVHPRLGPALPQQGFFPSCSDLPLRKGNFLEGLLSCSGKRAASGSPGAGADPGCPLCEGMPIQGCSWYPRTRAGKNHHFALPVASLALFSLPSALSAPIRSWTSAGHSQAAYVLPASVGCRFAGLPPSCQPWEPGRDAGMVPTDDKHLLLSPAPAGAQGAASGVGWGGDPKMTAYGLCLLTELDGWKNLGIK